MSDEAAAEHASSAPARRRRWPRLLAWTAAVTLVFGVVAGEIVARFVLGMGDPPLYMADPQIEYLPVPSRTYKRFGNTVSYNSYSMRSPEFPARKSDPRELRIMVLGDSVVNGGNPIDQADLATTRLPAMLRERLDRPVVVGNIACGSWGPPNLLAYVNKHGLFDADVVVIVLNSEDAADAPTFEPLSPDLPTRRPILALQEAFSTYVPKAFSYHVLGRREKPAPEPAPTDEGRRAALGALETLINTARSQGARVLIVHHPKLSELTAGRMDSGYDLIRGVAARAGVRMIETRDEMVRLITQEQRGYRDYIHPDEAGQEALARLLADELARMVRDGL
jgi:hypothetical protein